MDLLSWFAPLNIWDQYLSHAWDRFKIRYQEMNPIPVEAINKCYTIFMISLNCRSIGDDQTGFAPNIEIYRSNEWPLSPMENPQIRMIAPVQVQAPVQSQTPTQDSILPKSLQLQKNPNQSDSNLKDLPSKKTSGSCNSHKTHMIKTPSTRKNSGSSTYHHQKPPRVAHSNTMYQEKPNTLLDQILRNSGSQIKTGKMKNLAEKSFELLTRSKQ
ncbi:hypothetical protein TIFTF001_037012 [Ficus carica]|uniref:Uncharacterized protein n=1 Tax=Ficus carica TaxID=3494 RepID=A0AA88J8F1_FICCA|nr:hypothetical protein TIFTF001_037012 [Ficus carica]